MHTRRHGDLILVQGKPQVFSNDKQSNKPDLTSEERITLETSGKALATVMKRLMTKINQTIEHPQHQEHGR
jgi:hypothetical protein